MKQSKAIIENNLDNNPEFQYHLDTHFLKIAENLESHPDIAIESCKSFLESISRTIIKNIEWEDYPMSNYEKMNFPDLTRRMMNYLSDYADFQDWFVDQMMSLMRFLWNYRNDTGDISHGRVAPKEKISTIQDAILVMQMTDTIWQYVLWIYFSIDFEFIEDENAYEADKYIEFNQILDDDIPIDWISYSKALFEQDLPAYIDKYDNFIASK
jgi:hypothetical protein